MKMTLEQQTEAFIKQLAAKGAKPINELTPSQARAALEEIQSPPMENSTVQVEIKSIPVGPKGKVAVHIFRPQNSTKKLPVIVYFHGAGWVMGSSATHDHLVRELTLGADAAVVFVDYSRSPEDKFPVAIEEAYAVTKYISEQAESFNLDAKRLAVAGDSVGGNMAIAVTFLAKERRGPKINCQVLFYPVTSAELNSPSYKEFAEGPWLTKAGMEWFWNSYEPDTAARKKPIISPLLATLEQLQGLPKALVITGENDVLRDEGEQYAAKMMQAGNRVMAARFLGTIHDFLMLHALAKTPAAEGALFLTNAYLRKEFSHT